MDYVTVDEAFSVQSFIVISGVIIFADFHGHEMENFSMLQKTQE